MTANAISSEAAAAYSQETFRKEAAGLLSGIADCTSVDVVRERLVMRISQVYADITSRGVPHHAMTRARDCANVLMTSLQARSEKQTGFSLTEALWDIAAGRARPDLSEAFFAEIIHWVRGLEGRGVFAFAADASGSQLKGRTAAIARSLSLDDLWHSVQQQIDLYPNGLSDQAQQKRLLRRNHVLRALGGSQEQWDSWQWQVQNIMMDAPALGKAVRLSDGERASIDLARKHHLPFGVTPYYASLMDDDGSDDVAIRAQVIPPIDYVEHMVANRASIHESCDFMLESDTSPVDLVTRRYPSIAILKPYNTCPQICVYCQRNWQIQDAMAPDALCDWETISRALAWIGKHKSITEVLLTGGDPLAMEDAQLARILEQLSKIEHVDLIRIGTRTPVTLPMRVTKATADMLGSFRKLGRRDVAVITHVEHPYEVTMELAQAVDNLRRAGIGVYNQQVYTFYVSRRFESALLRLLVRRIGIDPYYTFAPKGKQETAAYRVPLARILQEAKEEARLLPGLRRSDEPVYNLPGLGKNHLRAGQHRDLLGVLPNGSRVYEFHPWEKNIVQSNPYVTRDVAILDYLRRLENAGEDADAYQSIWYYF